MEYVSPFDERRREPEPLAPRRATLEGARVALLDITKRRGGWTGRRSATRASSGSASPRTRPEARGSRCTSSAGSRATTRS